MIIQEVSYKDIIRTIGSPEDAVQGYIENVDYSYLKSRLDISGNILRVLNCIVWIAVLFCFFRTNMIYKEHMDTIQSYHSTIENVIEEDEPIENIDNNK